MPSVMQRIGTPNAHHNLDNKYRAHLEHVDSSLSKYNEIVRHVKVEDIYDEKLQPAFVAFNERQKRKDRRLDVKWNCTDALGYQRALDKASQESKNKIDQKGRPPIREIVWQFGNPEQGYGCLNQTEESRSTIRDMLLECQAIAEKRYPQLAFGDVVFHADEVSYDAEGKLQGSLHLHADFVPLCYQNKQGPDVQVAFERCLREMGFKTFESWKHDLDNIMETVLERHGLERTVMGNTEKHQNSTEYHRQQRVIAETKELKQQKSTLQQEVGDLQKDIDLARNEAEAYKEIAVTYREQADQANDEFILVEGDLQEAKGELQQTKTQLQELDVQLQEKNLDYMKAVGEEIESRMEQLPEKINRKAIPMSKDKVIVSAQDLDDLERRSGYIAAAKETETSAKARAAGMVNEAEQQAAQIQLEALAAAERIKMEQQQAWGEIDKEKEKLQRRSQALDIKEMKLDQDAEAIREYPHIQRRVRVLEAEMNKYMAGDDQKITAAVERATQPLRAQLQEKDKEISTLKNTISSLQLKLEDVAKTGAMLISAIKYVVERFAGKVTGAILGAAARIGERWMVEDGFPQHGNRAADLPKAVEQDLQLDLEYKAKGSQGKGVYTPSGTMVASVESLQDARDRFPECTITKEKTNDLVK